jgi:DNA-3-methyladenine glycosylase I
MTSRSDKTTRPLSEPIRCWTSKDPAYNAYHDDEWGRPVIDERGLLERLCLEGFQSGLSWQTILRKRDNFRKAFADFDPERVARYGERDVKRLLADAGIVRHRGKIEAAIANARGTLALRDRGTSLEEVVWSHRPTRRKPVKSIYDLPSTTPESDALSKELKRAGFRFVGPTTVYASMQACGVVNDHIARCFVRGDVQRDIDAAVQKVR